MTDVSDKPELARYEIRVDGVLGGFVDYHVRKNLVAFVHTEIDPAYGGQGLGTKLIAAALDDARAKGLEVLPFCPFVRGFIERHPAYVDLVPVERRDAFDL